MKQTNIKTKFNQRSSRSFTDYVMEMHEERQYAPTPLPLPEKPTIPLPLPIPAPQGCCPTCKRPI